MKLFALCMAFATTLMAASPSGPAVGTKAPDFEARDQNGVTHQLSSSLGPKGAILVFYRSADW